MREAAEKVALENGCPKDIVPQVIEMIDGMSYQAIVYVFRLLGKERFDSLTVAGIQKIIGNVVLANVETVEALKKRDDWADLEKENNEISEAMAAAQREAQQRTLNSLGAVIGQLMRRPEPDPDAIRGLPKPDPNAPVH